MLLDAVVFFYYHYYYYYYSFFNANFNRNPTDSNTDVYWIIWINISSALQHDHISPSPRGWSGCIFKWKRWVPLGEHPKFVPPSTYYIYIYICEKRAYGGIFREQTATGLNSQKCGPHILPLPGLGRILAGWNSPNMFSAIWGPIISL